MLVNQPYQAAVLVNNLFSSWRYNSLATSSRPAHSHAKPPAVPRSLAESLQCASASTEQLSVEERQHVAQILNEIEVRLRSRNKYKNASLLNSISSLRATMSGSTSHHSPAGVTTPLLFSTTFLNNAHLHNHHFEQVRSFRTRRGMIFNGLQYNRTGTEQKEDASSSSSPSGLPRRSDDSDKRNPPLAGLLAARGEPEPRTPYLRFVHAAGQTSKLVMNVAMAWLVLYFCYLVLEWTGRLGSKEQSANSSGTFSKSIGPLTFNASNVKEFTPETVTVTLDDVRGCDEVKRELEDVVSFLKEPQRFTKMGAKLPRGILLVGPPGTGKTLIARAIAGEANVPFFFAAGSEFDEVFVGTGAKRIRQLFDAAKQRSPCIIFIDEIDAVGGKRTSSPIHPYANQTINQLLSEMDGFEQHDSIIVLAATNRKDHLDSALLRPGRFDETVHIHAPDVRGRREIFDLYVGKVKFDKKDCDIDSLARATIGMTGADIKNMVNQAALLAALGEGDYVRMEHFWAAYDKLRLGPARERIRDESTNFNTAIHEAGHAIIASLNKNARPVHKVTIVSRGSTLGHTAMLPEKDEYGRSLQQLLAEIDVCLGGRIAEELAFGVDGATTGASSDLQNATNLAESMVKHLGFSKKAGVRTIEADRAVGDFYMPGNADTLAPATRQLIDEEINRILDEAYQRVRKILLERDTELRAVADALMKHETISGEDVREIIKSPSNYKLSAQTLAVKKLPTKQTKDEGSKPKSASLKPSVEVPLNDK